MVRDQRGQTSAEYLGMLLLVAVVIGALFASGVGGRIAGSAGELICQIAGSGCESAQASPGTGGAAALERREEALAGFAARGETYADLLEQARAARERGDLAEAERLLGLLEHYERLSRGDRGDILDALVAPGDAAFDDLVDQETIDGDGSNRRYFRVEPSPGDGIIVMDFFIPGASSGPLKGDDRDTQDPLLGEAGLDRSRIVVVIDRETGRGVIMQSQTCAADRVPGNYCEDPRPIELRDPETRPQINPIPGPQGANEFRVDGGPGSLELEYDALNSITPVTISVDGTVRFERGPNGDYRVVSDSRDPYPRIVTGQYRPGRDPVIVDETDDEPVLPGAFPEPVRDAIDGVGEVRDTVCDLPHFGPIDPIGPFGRRIVC